MIKNSRWSFIREAGKNKNGKTIAEFQCDCGTIKVLTKTSVTNGYSKSCGCLSRDISKEIHRKHGKSNDRIYKIYYNMVSRCENENVAAYKDYGGRGIDICDSWKQSFDNFYKDMKHGYSDDLTLERLDPNKGYTPDNCIWVAKGDQSRNNTKRKDNKSGVVGVHFSEAKNAYISQWCDSSGKRKSKTFSVNKYGKEKAYTEAVAYRTKMIESLIAEGINYSEYHGADKIKT